MILKNFDREIAFNDFHLIKILHKMIKVNGKSREENTSVKGFYVVILLNVNFVQPHLFEIKVWVVRISVFCERKVIVREGKEEKDEVNDELSTNVVENFIIFIVVHQNFGRGKHTNSSNLNVIKDIKRYLNIENLTWVRVDFLVNRGKILLNTIDSGYEVKPNV